MHALIAAEVAAATSAFGGSEEDSRIWAAIAWRVGAEAFHFAVRDKLAEDAVDGRPRHPAAAFQAFLNERFPNDRAARGAIRGRDGARPSPGGDSAAQILNSQFSILNSQGGAE